MTAIRMDGKALAAKLREDLQREVTQLISLGCTPHLAVVLVGEDPASQVYVRNKERACADAGIRSTTIRLPDTCNQEALMDVIDGLNADDSVHGILVQLPLPAHLDERAVLERIDPAKDVDGFHPVNAGLLYQGRKRFVPCTPLGVMRLLEAYHIDPAGKQAVVIGRSNIVGKPMAELLLEANATVTICHSRTADLASITRQADILIVAIGKPAFITGDMVKPGAAVIDVGINRVDGKLIGDVDGDSVQDVAGWLTPVPGGVGPMTIAMLLENTVKAAKDAR